MSKMMKLVFVFSLLTSIQLFSQDFSIANRDGININGGAKIIEVENSQVDDSKIILTTEMVGDTRIVTLEAISVVKDKPLLVSQSKLKATSGENQEIKQNKKKVLDRKILAEKLRSNQFRIVLAPLSPKDDITLGGKSNARSFVLPNKNQKRIMAEIPDIMESAKFSIFNAHCTYFQFSNINLKQFSDVFSVRPPPHLV